MIFRFTLSHDILGSLEISPPDGWKDAVLKLERDKNFHSLVEYFDGSFIFYGDNGEVNGGIDFIREVESTYGFDADLSILIEISFEGYTYETVFSGLLKLEAIQERENNTIQVPIVRNDFWSKFINRMETPVDLQSALSLDNEVVSQYEEINLKLSSQKIQKTSVYDGLIENASTSDYTYGELDQNNDIDSSGASEVYFFFSQASFDPIQTEIEKTFSLPFSFEELIGSIFNVIELESEGGSMAINYSLDAIFGVVGSLVASSAESDPSQLTDILLTVRTYYQINDNAPVSFTSDAFLNNNPVPIPSTGSPVFFTRDLPIQYSGSVNINTQPGDLITVYNEYELEFIINVGSTPGSIEWNGRSFFVYDYNSDLEFTLQSVAAESTSESFLLHDVAGQIIDRTISRDGTFYSEYLGSPLTNYRQYDFEGCGWKHALLKGLQLRQYSLIEKPFFLSFKTWWDGANPILNLGLGYEEIDGVEVIRVEEKEHFYDREISLYISNVYQISRVYDPERIFKTVKIGYKQWQSENISGIDDPQTKRTYASRLQKAGTDLTMESEFIAASLAIETTRRTTREKSADYKFDNETFIIAINPIPVDVSPETSPDVSDFAPELDENFDSVTNLLNAETRYNLRLTPARNLIRWLNFLSGGLQSYIGSTFKFTAGEGNYDMESDMSNVSDGCDEFKLPLAEDQDIPVSTYYLHLAQAFEITIPMEWEDYKTIRDNRKKAIGISQTDENHQIFFIKDLEYKLVEGTANITAWPLEPFPIQVINSVPAMIQCVASDILLLTVDNTHITVDSIEFTVDQTQYTI